MFAQAQTVTSVRHVRDLLSTLIEGENFGNRLLES